MNRQKWLILIVVLGMLGVTARVLAGYSGRQKLSAPGVRTEPLAGTSNLEVVLPARVLDYDSKAVPEAPTTVGFLPADTSYGQRVYRSPLGTYIVMNVVLMGADRTSLHKPQNCLPGQGATIEKTEVVNIPISKPHPYDLPVIKLNFAKTDTAGHTREGIFLYWYVTDGAVSADANAARRLWLNTRHLVQTGEMQRWAYVVCYTFHAPGDEAGCFARMKDFLADAVPQFQTSTAVGGNVSTQ